MDGLKCNLVWEPNMQDETRNCQVVQVSYDSATSSDTYCMINNMVSIFPSSPPNKPTTPVINATTIQTLTFSFSVDFGSSPSTTSFSTSLNTQVDHQTP